MESRGGVVSYKVSRTRGYFLVSSKKPCPSGTGLFKTTATAPITPSSLSETPFSISLALTAFSIPTTFDIEYGSSRSRQGKRQQKTLLPICLL
jgi:hypothetical protein